MMGTLNIVNTLSGLLIITSLVVIETKKPQRSVLLYSLQSLVLVIIFLALAVMMKADQLYLWAASAFITKAILVPFILYRALGRVKGIEPPENVINPAISIVLAAAALAVSYFAVSHFELKTIITFKPALAISLTHFFFGLICILTQRNIMKQVLGYCLMENGAHLTLAIMAYNAPEIVEIGIATDAVFAVIIMVVISTQIAHKLNTLDSSKLTALKG
jgi:hydrogenase-4 component E